MAHITLQCCSLSNGPFSTLINDNFLEGISLMEEISVTQLLAIFNSTKAGQSALLMDAMLLRLLQDNKIYVRFGMDIRYYLINLRALSSRKKYLRYGEGGKEHLFPLCQQIFTQDQPFTSPTFDQWTHLLHVELVPLLLANTDYFLLIKSFFDLERNPFIFVFVCQKPWLLFNHDYNIYLKIQMIPSQRRDGVFTFNMHTHPLLPIIVDNSWRKDSFKDVNIYVPESAKNLVTHENQEIPQIFTKFTNEKGKQWNDIGIPQMLGRFSDLRGN